MHLTLNINKYQLGEVKIESTLSLSDPIREQQIVHDNICYVIW